MVLRCVFKNKANYGRYFYMCYAAGSKMGHTCGQFNWVDMEQKLGLLSPPGAYSGGGGAGAVGADGAVSADGAVGADDQGTISKSVQREEQQQASSATNALIDTSTESEGRSSKHPRSPTQDHVLEQVDHEQESELDLAEELQEDDTALLEQQWEAIDEADDPTLE